MEARRVQGVAVRLSWKCSGSTTGWAPALPDHSSILRLHAPDGCQSLLQVVGASDVELEVRVPLQRFAYEFPTLLVQLANGRRCALTAVHTQAPDVRSAMDTIAAVLKRAQPRQRRDANSPTQSSSSDYSANQQRKRSYTNAFQEYTMLVSKLWRQEAAQDANR